MDVNTHSPEGTGESGRAGKLDGYTIHLLKADGTIATVGKKRRDGTVDLTVEVRDRKGERRIPVKVARNPRSPEFTRAVGEMKAELLQRVKDGTVRPKKRSRPRH
jgi:NADPH:quinone reductase-like Zn-dependent oxidoreductase